MSLEDVIKNEVEDRKKNGTSLNEYDLVTVIAPFFILVNPPLFIVVTICAEIVACYKRKGQLDESKMPDKWLKNVAESDKVSKDGLEFLGKRLAKNGYISVSDSIKFLDIEKSVADKAKQASEKTEALADEGAVLLLEKANSVCDGMFKSAVDSWKKSVNIMTDLGNKAVKATTDVDIFSFIRRNDK